jgi:hypothetical protein
MGSLQDEAAFWRHMETIHSDVIEAEKGRPEKEYLAWRDVIKTQAFSVSSVSSL